MQVQVSAPKPISLGISLIRQQKYLEALDRFKAYLRNYPDDLALILINLYKELIKDESKLHLRLVIVELYIQFSRFKEAYEELEDMYEIDPAFSQTYFLLGKLYQKSEDKHYVLTIFKDAFDKGIRDSVILDILPKLYLDQNQIYESIDIFETLLETSDMTPHYYKVLSELYKQIGEHEKSIRMYTILVDSNPQFIPDACNCCESILSEYSYHHTIRNTLITLYIKSHQLQKSLEHIEKLIMLEPSFSNDVHNFYKKLLNIFPSESEVIMSFTRHLIAQQNYTDAIDLLSKLYDTYQRHQDFIEESLSAIRKKNNDHALTKLHYINFLIFKEKYHEVYPQILELMEKEPDLLDDLKSSCFSLLQSNESHRSMTCFLLAKIFYHQKKWVDSLNYCHQSDMTTIDSVTLKARLLLKQENLNEAGPFLTKQLQKFPFEKSLHKLIRDFFKTQDEQEHLRFSSVPTIINHLKLGESMLAIERCQQSKADDSDFIHTHLLLIRSFLESQKYTQALQTCINLEPVITLKAPQYLCSLYFLKSISQYNLFQFNDSLKTLESIFQIDINHSFSLSLSKLIKDTPLTESRGLTLTGLINPWSKNITPSAIQNSEERIYASKKQTPLGFGLSHNNNGAHFIVNDNLISAESEFKLALQLEPNVSAIHSNLAFSYLLQKEYDKAKQHLQDANNIQPSLDLILMNQGLLAFAQDNTDVAIEKLQKVIEINPLNIHAYFNLAMMYYVTNNLYLSFTYLNKIKDSGLLFIQTQRAFMYLDKKITSIEYWVHPPSEYGFDSLLT